MRQKSILQLEFRSPLSSLIMAEPSLLDEVRKEARPALPERLLSPISVG
jgi:hypothetical protein